MNFYSLETPSQELAMTGISNHESYLTPYNGCSYRLALRLAINAHHYQAQILQAITRIRSAPIGGSLESFRPRAWRGVFFFAL
jgi:hypothetical protein